MTELTFKLEDGRLIQIVGRTGLSVMEVAIQQSVPGIDNICGGNLQCGSCHVYLAPETADQVSPPEEAELAMLDCVLHRKAESRLCCQLMLGSEHEGLKFEVPPASF